MSPNKTLTQNVSMSESDLEAFSIKCWRNNALKAVLGMLTVSRSCLSHWINMIIDIHIYIYIVYVTDLNLSLCCHMLPQLLLNAEIFFFSDIVLPISLMFLSTGVLSSVFVRLV